jgi:hypothetical protein
LSLTTAPGICTVSEAKAYPEIISPDTPDTLQQSVNTRKSILLGDGLDITSSITQ